MIITIISKAQQHIGLLEIQGTRTSLLNFYMLMGMMMMKICGSWFLILLT